jgi:hypothetical protein
MKHNRSIEITLVRLRHDGYGEKAGQIGYVEALPGRATGLTVIRWLAETPGAYRISPSVASDDLEPIGQLLVKVPDDLIDEEIERAKVSIPQDLVIRRARQLVQEMSYEIGECLLGRFEQRGENKLGNIR